MGEWIEWHRRYASEAGLAARLRMVQEEIRRAVDRCPPGPIAVVSICAGDGRDLLGTLRDHPRRLDVRARLVELDPELAARGRRRAAELGLAGIKLRVADAAETSAYAGAVPADVVLICGVFGNVTDEDVEATIRQVPGLCAPGATVIWTRGRFEPDLTPAIRAWFTTAGFDELAFHAIPGSTASVGVNRLAIPPPPFHPGVRLFTFLEGEARPSTRARARGESTPG